MPVLEIIAQTFVLTLLLPLSSPFTLISPTARISTPCDGLFSVSKTCGFLASSPVNIGDTPFCLKVKALFVSPTVPLAINEIPVPSTFGVPLVPRFTILYCFAPLFVESSARRITLPSALIWSTRIFVSKLAMLIKEVFLAPLVLVALILPAIFVLTDFVKSLAVAPMPVQTPSAQGPTSVPIAPFVTVTFKSALFVVAINVLLTPLFNKSPFVTAILTFALDVILLSTLA